MGADTSKTGKPAAPIEPHQQSLCLIICMMRCGKNGKTALIIPFCKRRIARPAGIRLKISRFNRNGDCPVRDSYFPAQPADKSGFFGALRPQSVIYCRSFNAAGHCSIRKQQQGKAIWPARDSNAQLSFTCPKRRQTGAKPFD